MSKTLNFLRAGAIALMFASPVAAEEALSAKTVMATVNGIDITLGQMIAVREALPDQYKDLPSNVLFDSILEQLIQQTALTHTFGGDVPLSVVLMLENEKRALLATKALEDFVDVHEIGDADLQELYERRFAHLSEETEFNASHILVTTEDEAKSLVAELEAGADFAELAKAKSTGPSGPSGGELGWFGNGQMVKQFEDAVATMTVGDISAPVQTQFGWHVIKLNNARAVTAPSFEETRQELIDTAQEEAVREYIATLSAEATIEKTDAAEIDPEILKRSDLIADPIAQD
ncbi:putative parvulin-type peptidyl-prolyl cis-trans isomerase precursor [Shimia sp. SK013]|uniref:peptidylprolyl isomerase n=1 Tax=Shimia sp. SK013 TaxID=1389006 RepID=UPI0006B426FA|nr:peptidylprolyl isomerase [Shimia sp. SK013]KPA23422.1 putative parvulin-type peptidyl-prolyl cis-trans isomerase precursor [Shimia sp. SK013]